MKMVKVLVYSMLISLAWQLMAMDPPQQAIDMMSLNYIQDNGFSVFQNYKTISEIAKKNDHPQYAAKMSEAISLAEKFRTGPMTCQNIIDMYRFFDFAGLFLPEGSARNFLSNKIKEISNTNNCKEEYKKIQSDYASKRFNELLLQKVSKEDAYAIKVVDRFIARYRAFVDDKELATKVMILKKQGNVAR